MQANGDEGPACPFLADILQRFAHLKIGTDSGYLWCSLNSKKILIHREVAIAAYGAIPPRYHVHHVDLNKLNNRADNLEILSPTEHARRHRPKRRPVICAYCDKEFLARNKEADERIYCNQVCFRMSRRVTERPDADTLQNLLITINNWSAIGKMYGVSDNAVRKWSKRYQLDLSVCDGRKK